MALSMIDGAVVSSELKRRRKNINVFASVRFAQADGSERTMKNLIVNDEVARHMTPGNRGRFYLHSYFDARGVHGFRGTDGATSAFSFPAQNERIFQIVFFMNLFWISLRLFVMGNGVPLLGVGLVLLSTIGWIWGRNTRVAAQRQFAGDGGQAAARPPLAEQPA